MKAKFLALFKKDKKKEEEPKQPAPKSKTDL